MPCLFLEAVPDKDSIKITGENARYLISVLRLRAGAELTLLDPEGSRYRARITKTARAGLEAKIMEKLLPEPEPAVGVILLQGILKGRKMDMVIQKTTELGVKEIIPLVTERAQIRETRKQGRWQKIALEASRQSGRAVVPAVRAPVKIEEKHQINPMPCYRLGFNRASCMPCIFGNSDQWLSVKRLSPETFETIANYEAEFGCVIGRDKLEDGTKVGIKLKVLQPIKTGPRKGCLPEAYEMDPKDMAAAMATEWAEPIILAPGEWTLPSGAFKEDGCGPS